MAEHRRRSTGTKDERCAGARQSMWGSPRHPSGPRVYTYVGDAVGIAGRPQLGSGRVELLRN